MVETTHSNLLMKEIGDTIDLAQARETPQTIDESAALWAARMDRGPLSDEHAQTLETWLAGDSRRLGALMRARALYSRTESAWSLEPVFNPRPFNRRPAASPTRRRLLGWGAGGAVAASVGAATVIGYGLTASTSYATERGEMRQVPLGDGSNLTLNTLSEVRVRALSDVSDVRLVTGEVLLSVANDAQRACTLRVEDWRVQAASGAIFVSRLPGRPAQVTTHRGAVEISGPNLAGPLRLEAGRQLVLSEAAGLERRIKTLSADQLSRELSWREGQLAFHDESLALAVAAFARYSRQPIVIRDPRLAGETVSGLFAANDPAGFAQAISAAFGVPVLVEPDRILIG